MTYGHNYKFTAEHKAAAIKAAKEYAEKNHIHGYIVMNRNADIIFAVERDPEPPKE
jgi:heptaprenylglyceryl phosphate synthase